MDDNTTIDWNNYMRCLCVDYLTSKPIRQIGGEGKIVEIDESLFTKRKNNAGRVLPQQWIFGGLCRETKECFLVKVPDRSAKTLIEYIKTHITNGSTIFSDCWKGYKTEELEEAGFEHFKVNHSYNFLNPDDPNIHTQTVERMWGSAKWRNKRHRGTARHHLESYLAEFMCRQEIGEVNFFDWTLSTIVELFPPEESLPSK